MPDQRYGSSDALRGSVAFALALITLLNILQFKSIEEDAGNYYNAVSSHGDAPLIDIVRNHMSTTRERFLMYLELGQLANRPTVLVDPDASVHTEELYGLTGAHNVVASAEDISIDGSQAQWLRERATLKGRQREAGEYIISPARQLSQKADALVIVVEHDGVLYLVEQPWSVLTTFEGGDGDG